MTRPSHVILGLVALAGSLGGAGAAAERIKDIAEVAGVRDNQLLGYGLVVGLDGTGGKSQFTVQSLRNMLTRLGVRMPPELDFGNRVKNVAAVALHATLPPFAKPGQKIDVTASSLGDAKSLRGGTLLLSPLKGVDGKVYALAQGNLIVGGFGAATNDGNSISVNIPTVGRVPGGATVEVPAPTGLGQSDRIVFNLNRPDFTTAKRLADAINRAVGEGTARPIDAVSVQVAAPRDRGQQVGFVAMIENIVVTPGEAAARVIVNARTGTVVIGRYVTVTAAAVTHGNLSVTISNTTGVNQPPPLSRGDTVVVPSSEITVEEEANRMFLFKPGVSLDAIVRAVNQVGAAPSDLVAILEALKEAGALRAELIVI